MIEEIGAPIDVVASFAHGKMAPRLFFWRNRQYRVMEITGVWSDYEGAAKRFFFSVVTDGANIYEISFQTRTLLWRLMRIHYD